MPSISKGEEIKFMETLPKTKDGKIDRRILRVQDLGIRPMILSL